MVTAEDAIAIYRLLSSAGIWACLTGGWGIDALLREQTRPHKDLDIFLRLADVVRASELMVRQGYTLGELWSENRWTLDANGARVATAFVLQDSHGRQVDIHALRFDDLGHGIPAWEDDGLIFRPQELAGEGAINGAAVRCLAPTTQLRLHAGYLLPAEHARDLDLLRAQLGDECGQLLDGDRL